MHSKHLQIDALALILLLLVAPAEAASTTVVDGHRLDNKSIGFYGFALEIPSHYDRYTPPNEKDFTPTTFADLAWINASTLDRHAGFSTTERIPFQNTTCGMVVVVTASSLRIPPVKQEKKYLGYLDKFASWSVPRSPYVFVNDVRKIGGTHVSRVGIAKDGVVFVTHFVLIPPSTILSFHGAGPEEFKDALLQDLDASIATLNIGKRPELK